MRNFWANFFRISWKFILLGLCLALFLYFSDGKFCEKWLEEAIYLTGIFMIPILILLSLGESLEDSEWRLLDFLYVLFVVALAILFLFLGLLVLAFFSWDNSWSGASLGST